MTGETTDVTVERLLDFERRYPRWTGEKHDAIIRELALTPPTYFVMLDRALDTTAALEIDATFTRHLIEQRRRRLAGRSRLLRAADDGSTS